MQNLMDLEMNLIFLKKIRDGDIDLIGPKENENKHKSDLNEIKRGKHKSKGQKSAIYTIEMLYKARNCVINFF